MILLVFFLYNSFLFMIFFFFFFNDTATTEIYTLSLHDALPIYSMYQKVTNIQCRNGAALSPPGRHEALHFDGYNADRKSTRLNSSHLVISYAVFCLKKKKKKTPHCSQHLHRHTIMTSYHNLCWL